MATATEEFEKQLLGIQFLDIPIASTFLGWGQVESNGKLVAKPIVEMSKLQEFIDSLLQNQRSNEEKIAHLRDKFQMKRREFDLELKRKTDLKERAIEEHEKMMKRKAIYDSQVNAIAAYGGGQHYRHQDDDDEPTSETIKEDDNPTGCPEAELSETEDDEKMPNGKPWRPGFAPTHWRGWIHLPVVTCLKRNGYGRIYSVSFHVKLKRNVSPKKHKGATYLRRSFNDTYFLGRRTKFFDWMWNNPELMKNPRKRHALIYHFVKTCECRVYRGMSSCLNAEMSGISWNGGGRSYIEANSRSRILGDGYKPRRAMIKGKMKKIKQTYASQFLRRSDKKVDIRDPSIDVPAYTPEQISAMIREYGLEQQFATRRTELYKVIFPWKGDWNYKRDYVMVSGYYTGEDPDFQEKKKLKPELFREQINLALATMRYRWQERIAEGKVEGASEEIQTRAADAKRRLENFKGLYLCDPRNKIAVREIGYIPSHFREDGYPQFRSFHDFDDCILKGVTEASADGKAESIKDADDADDEEEDEDD
jgi:hypothetical protein